MLKAYMFDFIIDDINNTKQFRVNNHKVTREIFFSIHTNVLRVCPPHCKNTNTFESKNIKERRISEWFFPELK